MPNYLTKEEIRQWRSSLEKITLEEFAARLGKEVEESKPTNDVVDIVMKKGTSSNTNSKMNDGFSQIAERAFERERQISHTPFSIGRNELLNKKKVQEVETPNVEQKAVVPKRQIKETATILINAFRRARTACSLSSFALTMASLTLSRHSSGVSMPSLAFLSINSPTPT